jgi:hypothetical protein
MNTVKPQILRDDLHEAKFDALGNMVTGALKLALLGLVFLSGCESFLPLKVGFLNDGDTTVELLIDEKILTVKPKEYALTNARKDMQICLNGILQFYSFDTSENSHYWKYIRNSRIFVRLNNEGKLWYSMNKDIKQQEDELVLRTGARQDQIRCAKQSMPGKQ